MTKVAFMSYDLMRGGAEHALLRVLEQLNGQAELIVGNAVGPLMADLPSNVPVSYILPDLPLNSRLKSRLVTAGAAWATRSYDVLVPICPTTTIIATKLQCIHRARIIPWIHFDLRGFPSLLEGRYGSLLQASYTKADSFVFCSNASASGFTSQIPLTRDQGYSTIYNPMADRSGIPSHNKKLIDQLRQQGVASIFCFVGRLEDIKQPHHAIQAVLATPSAHLIVMGGGSLEKTLRSTYGTNPRIHLVGDEPNPLPVLQQSNGLIISSKSEASPLVVLEALSQGVPVFSYAIPGVQELLGDGLADTATAKQDDWHALSKLLFKKASTADCLLRASCFSNQKITQAWKAIIGI